MKYRNDDEYLSKAFVLGMGCWFLLTTIPLMLLGGFIMKYNIEQAAIKAKVAHYDQITGDFKFNSEEEQVSP